MTSFVEVNTTPHAMPLASFPRSGEALRLHFAPAADPYRLAPFERAGVDEKPQVGVDTDACGEMNPRLFHPLMLRLKELTR
jgi:hypothetical protein